MASSYEGFDGKLAPWSIDRVQKIWDKYFANDLLKFRTYQNKGTKANSAKKLDWILRRNTHWLNAGVGGDIDMLLDEFCAQLVIVGTWLKDHHERQDAWDIIGGPAATTFGFWSFAGSGVKRDGLRNLSTLYGLATGQGESIADKTRQQRLEKREAIKELEGCWKEVIRHAVMKLSAEQIEQLYPLVSHHCEELNLQIDWFSKNVGR